MWAIRFDLLPNNLSHSEHLCLRILRCTVIIWALSDARFVNIFSHIVHLISLIVLCDNSWRFKFLGDLNDLEQCLHWYGLCEEWVNLWDFKLLDVVKNAEQISHWKRFSGGNDDDDDDGNDAIDDKINVLLFVLSLLTFLLLLCVRLCNKSLFDVINSREQI